VVASLYNRKEKSVCVNRGLAILLIFHQFKGERMGRISGKNKTVLLASSIAGLLIIIFAVSQVNAIKNQLNDWKLIPQPEKVTELYFDDSTNLPTAYNPGVSQSFSFTIHNIEYQNEDYRYIVTEQGNTNSNARTLISGSINLKQNQYKSTALTIMPVDLGNDVTISVNLINVAESIDYHMREVNL
jgi:hypothetical protein